MEYQEVDRAVMEPDVYAGPDANEHRPLWTIEVEKEGKEPIGDVLEISASSHPPGTQVIIQEPICPKCGEVYENCMVRGYSVGANECDFDWHDWASKEFS